MKKFAIFALLILVIPFSLPVLAKPIDFSISASSQFPYPPPVTPSSTQTLRAQNVLVPYPAPGAQLATLTPLQQVGSGLNLGYEIFIPITVKNVYDRNVAVVYADTWAHDRNGSYPNFGSNCGCNDCTNYVSQAIYEGGLALKTGNWDPDNTFEWWYKPVLWWYENSKTWSATDWFNTYVHQYPNKFEIYPWPTALVSGDFFIMDLQGANPGDPPDGIPDHVRFIVGVGNTSDDQTDYTNGCGANNPIPPITNTLLINQHCVDRKHVAWDYHFPDNTGRWSIHVK